MCRNPVKFLLHFMIQGNSSAIKIRLPAKRVTLLIVYIAKKVLFLSGEYFNLNLFENERHTKT